MAKERIVIRVDLRIQRDQLLIAVDDQRIDLDQAQVLFPEQTKQPHHDLAELFHLGAGQAHAKAHLTRLVRLQASGIVDVHGDDFFRSFTGHLFDVHAPGGRTHEGNAAIGPVHQGGQVEFLLNIHCLGNKHAIDRQSQPPGLIRFYLHRQHALGFGTHLVVTACKLDATCLAAPAGVDLRLDHPHVATKAVRCFDGFLRRVRDDAFGHRDAVLSKQRLGLVFVKIHADSSEGSFQKGWVFSLERPGQIKTPWRRKWPSG